MNTFGRFCGLLLCLGLVSGCVERRMTVVSEPPGAQVYVNNRPIGNTPAYLPSQQFQYYGNYDITLVKEGYEPLLVHQDVRAPWYEWPGFDFFSENVVPWHIKDERTFPYQLQPHRIVTPEEVLRNADSFRARGQQIGPPAVVAPATETLQKPPRPVDDK